MTPALHMRISRREEEEANCLAAFSTEARYARSHSMKVAFTPGTEFSISATTAAPLLPSRPLK